jgi:hypothetical protein
VFNFCRERSLSTRSIHAATQLSGSRVMGRNVCINFKAEVPEPIKQVFAFDLLA